MQGPHCILYVRAARRSLTAGTLRLRVRLAAATSTASCASRSPTPAFTSDVGACSHRRCRVSRKRSDTLSMSDALVGIMMMEEAAAHRGTGSALDFVHQPAFALNVNRLYDGRTVRCAHAALPFHTHSRPCARNRAMCASEASTGTCRRLCKQRPAAHGPRAHGAQGCRNERS